MDKYLDSETFNQVFWSRAKKKEEINKAFTSAIARNYDIAPFKIENKKFTINELGISYEYSFKNNWQKIESLFDKPIKRYEEMLQNEEEMISAKTEALNLHITSLENDILKINQESDKALNEYALNLGKFYDINYLYELYCEPETDEKKRKYYLNEFDKHYQAEIAKIKELQQSPLGIAQIEAEYQTKKHEVFAKYYSLIKDDVNQLRDSDRYFETVGFVDYGTKRRDDKKLNDEFRDFFNNTYIPREKILKQKIKESNDALKKISYRNIEISQQNLDKISMELSALENENRKFASLDENQYLEYLYENGRTLLKKIIPATKINSNNNKVKEYNDKIKQLNKQIDLAEKNIAYYNERENRFIEYRKNALSNLSTYNKLKDLSDDEKDKILKKDFDSQKSEIKALTQYNEAMKAKGYSHLLAKRSEYQSKIDSLKNENKAYEASNKEINSLINENQTKINGIKEFFKESADLKKVEGQISNDKKILASLMELNKYSTLLLDSNVDQLAKKNIFLKMASDYLDVTEGVYVLRKEHDLTIKLNNKVYHPIKMAFDSYMHGTRASNLKIDPINFNFDLLDTKGIYTMHQSIVNNIASVEKEITRLDKTIYNPFSTIKEQGIKKQAKLKQKYNLALKAYNDDKKQFNEITSSIASLTEELEALNSTFGDYRNKITISGENLSNAKAIFDKNISQNEYIFQAKVKMRKEINENIASLKASYNKELKELNDEYDSKRKEAQQLNDEAILKLENSTIMSLKSDDDKIYYAKNIELKLKGQKTISELALERQTMIEKIKSSEVNKDKIINANNKKIEEINEMIRKDQDEIKALKGPLSNYTKITYNLNAAIKNKKESLDKLMSNIKESYRTNDGVSKLGKLALDYEFRNPTYMDKEYKFDFDDKTQYPDYIKKINEKLNSSANILDLRLLDENSNKDDLIGALNLLDEIQSEKEAFYDKELQSVNIETISAKANFYMKDKIDGIDNYFFNQNNNSLATEMASNHLILRGSHEYYELEKSLQALGDNRIELSKDEKLNNVKEKAMTYLSYKNATDESKLSANTKGRVMFALNLVARIDAYKALEEKQDTNLNKSVSYRQAIVIDELNSTNSIHRSNSVDDKVINKEMKK